MVACLLESQLQMIKNAMKYINLILVYIKSTTEAPEKEKWQGSSHLSRAYDHKMYPPPPPNSITTKHLKMAISVLTSYSKHKIPLKKRK
jgi:hypothetical protein